jgi:hypothetical protein
MAPSSAWLFLLPALLPPLALLWPSFRRPLPFLGFSAGGVAVQALLFLQGPSAVPQALPGLALIVLIPWCAAITAALLVLARSAQLAGLAFGLTYTVAFLAVPILGLSLGAWSI